MSEFNGNRLGKSVLQMALTAALGAGLALTAFGAAKAETALTKLLPKEIQTAGIVKVVTHSGVPPTMFFGEDGKTLKGLEADLTQALADALGVKLEFSYGTFDSLIPSINSGRADFAVGSIGDLKKRQGQVDFVDYASAGIALMVPKGNPKKLNGISSLCGVSVAVTRGSYEEAQASKQSEQCKADGKSAVNVQVFNSASEALLAMRSKRADVWFSDTAPVGYMIKQSNGEFELAGDAPTIALLGYAVAKDKTQLRDALKAGLEELVKNGTYRKIFSKWGQEPAMVDKISINKAYF